MKIKLLISFLFYAITLQAQIDTLKTDIAIEQFIKTHFKYLQFKMGNDSLKNGFWEIADLNHDGKKDLLVQGHGELKEYKGKTYEEMMIVLGAKRKPIKIEMNNFFAGFIGRPCLSKIISVQKKDYLVFEYPGMQYYQRKIRQNTKNSITLDSLLADTIYIENERIMLYTSKPNKKAISSVELITEGCLGECAIFELKIYNNQEVFYNGIKYVNKLGEYRLKIDDKDYNYLLKYLSNLRLDKLEKNYEVGWTDLPTAYLTITYEDGQIAKIQDYGMVGTYGLRVLYDFFLKLKDF